MRPSPKFLLAFTIITLFGISCDKEENKNPENEFIEYDSPSGNIGRAGGSVVITDQNSEIFGASVVIPEGALDKVQTVSISRENEVTSPFDSTVPIVRFEPEGLEFKKPINVILPNSFQEEQVKAFYISEDSALVREIPIIDINNQDNLITAQTDHFSRYFLSENGTYFMDITPYYIANKIKLNVSMGREKYGGGLSAIGLLKWVALTSGFEINNAHDMVHHGGPIYLGSGTG